MQVNDDQKPYCLSESDNEAIFKDFIEPTYISGTRLFEKPLAVFLGGQSGSGKSSLAIYYQKKLTWLGGYVVVNSDALREYHPSFATLQKTSTTNASYLVNPDTISWQKKLIIAAMRERRNLLLDGILAGDIEPILTTMSRLRMDAYQLEIGMLSVPARLSRFSIYNRFEDQWQSTGMGRWVGMQTHNNQYHGIPVTISRLEIEKRVDRVRLFERPGTQSESTVLYDNNLVDGEWETAPCVAQVLTETRNRSWTAEEEQGFCLAVQTVHRQMIQRGATFHEVLDFYRSVEVPYVKTRLATAADAQLYFTWANDPITRQQSFNSAPISWENHVAWFTRKLTDRSALLLVFETSENVPIGQVRFESFDEDLTGDVENGYTGIGSQKIIFSLGEAISISVDAQFRGKGIASVLIEEACEVIRKQRVAKSITAYIKPDNMASVRAFERAGFAKQHSSQPDRLRLVKG